MIYKKKLKNNVQKYRVWKGWTQKRFSEISNVSISEIRLIEKLKVTPHVSTRQKIANAFKINENQLFYKE